MSLYLVVPEYPTRMANLFALKGVQAMLNLQESGLSRTDSLQNETT